MKFTTAALLFLLLCAAPALPGAEEQDIEKLYKEVGAKLTCQCGCREQITKCGMQNCHSATPIRAEIREKLKAGMAVEQIVEGFVSKMGKQVLAAPPMKGFDLTAWIVPFLVLGCGLILVGWIAVKMRRPLSTSDAISPAQDARVEKELRDFEEES